MENSLSQFLYLSLFTVLYCVTTAFSIALLGNKNLIQGNLFQISNIITLITNWRFLGSMFLAVLSRLSFVLINNTLIKIPYLAGAATTVSVFITLISLVFILVVNRYYLQETLNLKQCIGALIVMMGIFIMLYK
ncbi:MAG: hypothetical protein EOO20_11070 [Chryseobacterium sp.]|nr:MAG: hypothetical protein EOO20_11070 [Chryseobacterium sp.]